MDFSGRMSFELDPQYIQQALALREKNWFLGYDKQKKPKAVEQATTIPTPTNFVRLDRVIRFSDHRQYLAYILAGHAYEHEADTSNLHRYCNGTHTCDIFPDSADNSKHIVLLCIRIPIRPSSVRAGSESNEQVLPEIGERVAMKLVVDVDIGTESWNGTVVRVPSEYAKLGRNVAIVAHRPPVTGGRVLMHGDYSGDFYFGHHVQPVSPLRTRIIKLMEKEKDWLKDVLLAQDNFKIEANTVNIPPAFISHIQKVCNIHNLNPEQGEAVMHYFTHHLPSWFALQVLGDLH